MKLIRYFDEFLKNTVNLNQTRLDLLEARVESIYVEIALDDLLGPMIRRYMPQGSWAHRTIIKPLAGKEFDADILLELTENTEWSENPKEYVEQLFQALRRTPHYSDMAERHRRAVRVQYANECHVDVVPYVVRADGSEVIANRTTNEFEATNPLGFTDWMKERDQLTNGHFRKVVRLLKYLRDSKGTFSCPSVILTTLLGGRVFSFGADGRYSDVPTTLGSAMSDLSAWLELHEQMPIIEDPSCPGTDFNHRWDEERYANFRTRMITYAEWIAEAYDEPDRALSLAAWQRIFGPDFKAPTSTSVAVAESASAKQAPGPRAPKEEFIEERGFVVDMRHIATIDGRATPRRGGHGGSIRRLGWIQKGWDLYFGVKTDVPLPYHVYWKVRNFGPEAEAANGLRGELIKEQGPVARHYEQTLYRGQHFIECYIVKDGRILASDRHTVRIL